MPHTNWKQGAWKYLIRTSMYGDQCGICGGRIAVGDKYHDGGYGRRAHLECAKRERKDEPKP
jgi:hypothetical protein